MNVPRFAGDRVFLLLALDSVPAVAQQVHAPKIRAQDTVAVAANPRYEADALTRFLLGDGYRDLWAASIRVPVLDLDHFAGGLELVERGGRKQTMSLRFMGADGREYVFRSVDKDPLVGRTDAFRGTPAGWLVRDQTSALFPASAVAIPPLLDAADVVHVVPRLAVMPDDARLGEARADFAGMLGMIEERPDEGEDDDLEVAGSDLVVGSDRLRERLHEGPEDRVDARAMLRARLMDAVLNDRDRHWDQWRWAAFERDDTRWWHPIPEDRDYVFVDFNGLLPSLVRRAVPHMVSFDGDFPSVEALGHNSFDMDRRLLAELTAEDWDSVAAALRERLTDRVIASAVELLPVPYQQRVGERLERTLRARRDGLVGYARRWYAWLSSEVDVHGSDAAEFAAADYRPDGTLEVRLFRLEDGAPAGEPFFHRRFLATETREVRIHLHGGDDRAAVRGPGVESGIRVRVVGGDGDDVLADSSGARVTFHDASGEENRFHPGPRTDVDTLRFAAPVEEDPISGARFRDFGSRRSTRPVLNYGSTLGFVVGGGVTRTRYGFRQVPHASEIAVSGAYSFRLNAVGLELEADWRSPNSIRGASLLAQATQLEPFHFFGFGNDSRAGPDDDAYLVEQDLLRVHPALEFHLSSRSRLSLGPELRYANLRPREGSRSLADAPAEGGFGQVGGRAEVTLDLRDQPALHRGGVVADFGATAFGATWSAAGPFGELHSAVATYLSLPGRRGPTLALRGGARHVWGDVPAHQAVFLGGWSTLRGHETERFAGDAALWGSAELRAPLARANLGVRGDLGALAFFDAGRVYLDGASPGGWHTAAGGGLWFSFDFQGTIVSSTVQYARGEIDKFRVQLGLPF